MPDKQFAKEKLNCSIIKDTALTFANINTSYHCAKLPLRHSVHRW